MGNLRQFTQSIVNPKKPLLQEFARSAYQPQVSYLHKNLDSDSAHHIMHFVNHVQTKGPHAAYENSPLIQAIAKDVFGNEAASTWGNNKLAKAFDSILSQISKRPNKAGLAL